MRQRPCIALYGVVTIAVDAAFFLAAVCGGQELRPASTAGLRPPSTSEERRRLVEMLARRPLTFEEVPGEGGSVRISARAAGLTFSATPDAITVIPAGRPAEAIRLRALKTRPTAFVEGDQRLSGEHNYFVGSDPFRWRARVPQYARAITRGAWPGIDIVHYGSSGRIEHDFEVQAGADPGMIGFRVESAAPPKLDEAGNLIIATSGGLVEERKPVAYQDVSGKRRLIPASFKLRGRDLSIKLGRYDRALPLVIDPVLSYASYLGGSSDDRLYGVAVDGGGNIYLAGETSSASFPTANALQATTSLTAQSCAFVTKLNPQGSQFIYSTYLCGNQDAFQQSHAGGVAVDGGGNAYVTGWAAAGNFPASSCNATSGNAFVSKLNSTGSALLYSICLGGSNFDAAESIAVDAGGTAFVLGSTYSSDFPVVNAYQATLTPRPADEAWLSYPTQNQFAGPEPLDLFVAKISPAGSVQFATYFGSEGLEYGGGIATDGLGNSYITGATRGLDFPKKNAIQSVLGGSDRLAARSTDGGLSWANGRGPTGRRVWRLLATGNGVLWAGTSHGLFKSTDSGATWSKVPELGNLPVHGLDKLGDGIGATIFAGTWGDGIYRGPSGGFSKVYSTQAQIYAVATNASPFASFPQEVMAWGGASPTESVDGGGFWSTPPIPFPLSSCSWSQQLSYRVYDLLVYGDTVLVADSGAPGITRFPNGVCRPTASVTGIPSGTSVFALSRASATTVYAATSRGIYRSDDNGANWSSSGLSRRAVAVAVDPGTPTTLFASIEGDGLYRSQNGGTSWTPLYLSSGGPTRRTASSVVVDSDGLVAAGFIADDDRFVARFNADGTLAWSTLLGGQALDNGKGIAVGAGGVFVAGFTQSDDFPTAAAMQMTLNGSPARQGSFVAKVATDGSAINYSTFYTGSGSPTAYAIGVDGSGRAVVAGTVGSGGLETVNPFQGIHAGAQDAFVTMLDPTGSSVVCASYLGGSGSERQDTRVAVAPDGTAYVAGYTASTDFPVVAPIQPASGGSLDAFVARIDPTGATIPVVASPSTSLVTATSAVLGGTVASDGGSAITERGVVLSLSATNPDPLIGGNGVTKSIVSGSTGPFTTAVTGLLPESGYSFKAYATNAVGTSYTSVGSIKTIAAPAAQLAISGGNNQTAAAGKSVPTPPSVIAQDANSNPISSVSVTFAVLTGGGSVTGATQVTNASGIATVGSWTLGTAAGTNNNTMAATANGLTGSPVTFTATALPALSINSLSTKEGNSGSTVAVFAVTLSVASSAAVTVGWVTQDGTASAGSDYTAASGILTFAPGETARTVEISVLGDTASESNEAFGVLLSNPVNATIARAIGQGTILNDDASSAPSRPQPAWQEFFAVDTLETPYVGDFNGDGKVDIITFTRQNPAAIGDVYVALSNGAKFGANTKWHDFFAITTDESVVIGDYNGDGKDDIATWLGKTSRQIYVALSTGSGMLGETVWVNSLGTDPTDLIFSGDVDGDGKDDLVAFARKEGKVYVALSDGTKFGTPTVWHNFFAVSTYERPRVADVNGDGKADIVTFATDSPTAFGDVYVATSNGTQFVGATGAPNDSAKWHDFFAIRPTEEIRIGDLNGDGRQDFFTFLPPPFAQCYSVLSQGTSMADNVEWAEKVAPLLGTGDNVYVGDVNGDGKADIIIFAQKEGKVFVSLAP